MAATFVRLRELGHIFLSESETYHSQVYALQILVPVYSTDGKRLEYPWFKVFK